MGAGTISISTFALSGSRNTTTLIAMTRIGMIELRSTPFVEVVYFAGHGFEVSGTNYLIPVDAKLQSDLDVEDESLETESFTTLHERLSYVFFRS